MNNGRGLVAILALLLPSCGAGGMGAPVDAGPPAMVPVRGNFEWSVSGGQSYVATGTLQDTPLASYNVNAAPDGSAFGFTLVGMLETGDQCRILGTFPDAVPPPVGHYPIAATSAPFAPASFSSMCFTARTGNIISFLFATSGEVVLTKSGVDDVQGTFSLRGTSTDVPPKILVATGGFNLGCLLLASDVPHCGPLSMSPAGGTCADLLACCRPDNPSCMQIYDMASPNGDVACGRVLTAFRPLVCPAAA